MITNNDIAYCGLDCNECRSWFNDVKNQIINLNEVLDKRNFEGISKEIPFMRSKYKGYKKLAKFFLGEPCPGCREGGGNPFCQIRKCCKKNEFDTCAECDSLYCKKFKGLLKIHNDGKIQKIIKNIQERKI